MINMKWLMSTAEKMLQLLASYDWLAALLTRLFVGYFFFETGWAKVHSLDTFTMRFVEWGIPYPAFNAALSAYTECVGGALTILGLATRFVSVAMIINMAVAVLSVKLKSVAGLNDFVELDEPLYALVYLWLMISGAGWLSIDYMISVAVRPALGSFGADARDVSSGLNPNRISCDTSSR
jgi:putative oxidoreductase